MSLRAIKVCFAAAIVMVTVGAPVAGHGLALQIPAATVSNPLKAFPNTTVRYYDVTGTDVRSIRAYMNAHGAKDPNDGGVFDAITRWHISWRWPVMNGVCQTSQVRMRFSADVLLPRLTKIDTLTPEVRNAWNRYMSALITHEAGHVRHAYEHMDEVAAAIRPAGCADANRAGQAAVKRLNQYDIEYDRETRHGETQGAIFPLR
jgi:predicted secreted Zn-dependent protease